MLLSLCQMYTHLLSQQIPRFVYTLFIYLFIARSFPLENRNEGLNQPWGCLPMSHLICLTERLQTLPCSYSQLQPLVLTQWLQTQLLRVDTPAYPCLAPWLPSEWPILHSLLFNQIFLWAEYQSEACVTQGKSLGN